MFFTGNFKKDFQRIVQSGTKVLTRSVSIRRTLRTVKDKFKGHENKTLRLSPRISNFYIPTSLSFIFFKTLFRQEDVCRKQVIRL